MALTILLEETALRVLTIDIERSSQCTTVNAPKRLDSRKCQADGTHRGLVDVPVVARVGVLYHLAALPIERVVFPMATKIFEKTIPLGSRSFVWLDTIERPRQVSATYVPEATGGVVIGAIAARCSRPDLHGYPTQVGSARKRRCYRTSYRRPRLTGREARSVRTESLIYFIMGQQDRINAACNHIKLADVVYS
jgi:hypothetical protein